ncbi:hypothetical protein CBW24_06820 [Pacificitalea manganoxidans]|uniref:Uncharacterized protein n=1 Tax=Pacificitalea manganoxidans TaxID=1411902 RepID=A0A291LYK7_9RHOB|nr:hypothetical protein [Pacificitalea manganoxidans]ATI41734.1 hypothetical protein CBW24_06820 [Pacificitalea manganoxidans]MDR6309196.1 hypothetical protein [Pacificitalea manganoxidans]
MTTNFITAGLAALVTLTAIPASADTAQLARSVGVEPGVYSTSQLVELKGLSAEEGNQFRVSQILDNPAGEAITRDATVNGHGNVAQLAASVGVEPGNYTLGELTALVGAVGEGDEQFRVNALRNGSSATATSSAHATQLAASLGVEPGAYSLNQLTLLKQLSTEDTGTARQQTRDILANPAG